MRAQAATFVGRDEELDQLMQLLSRKRLVTLTGAPGIGKSRLALELAARRGRGRARAVVELAPISRPRDVPRAVASALSIDEVGGQRLTDTLVARLSKRRMLLVLDNCEHLVRACAKLVHAVLGDCPEVRILAASREPLGLSKEVVWQVPPLPVPAEDAAQDRLAGYTAVKLFVDRAAAVEPGFALNPYVAPAVAEICRRLDGIPLAIELAAARVESHTPEEIERRLDDRFGLLTEGGADDLAHHQTLEAALDWSHALLSEAERTLLRRLSVFVGGFEFEAAEAVCAGGEIEAEQVSELIGELMRKSLLATDSEDSRPNRFRLLETIRAYAGERLQGAGERALLRDAHARFYLELSERAEPELTGPGQEEWFERLETERGNLRSAIEWSLSHGEEEQALRLAGSLVLFWRVRCHFSEGRELIEAAVSAGEAEPAGLHAKALWGAGFLGLMSGDPRGAVPALEQSLARFRELRDEQGCARALLVLGNCMQHGGDPNAVYSLLAESAELARSAGDLWCLAHALGINGFAHSYQDDLPAARPLLEECLVVARRAGDRQSLRMGLLGLGLVCERQGDYRLAEPLLKEAAEVTRDLREPYARATALEYLGKLTIGRGDYGRARELVREALTLTPEPGPLQARVGPLTLLAQVTRAEGDPAGSRLLFEEAQALARPGTALGALQGLGELAVQEGDAGAARHLLEQALELARATDRRDATAAALFGLAELARREDDEKRAAALHNEALGLRWEIRNAPGAVASVEAVAGLAAAAGRCEDGAQLFAAAEAVRVQHGYARPPWQAARYEADVALVARKLSARELMIAHAEGKAFSLDQAVAHARDCNGRRGRASSGWSSLTESEQQVAALAAQGLTNHRIAERLFISHWTVKKYLSRVYSKLGVAGRTELAREVGRSDSRPRTSNG